MEDVHPVVNKPDTTIRPDIWTDFIEKLFDYPNYFTRVQELNEMLMINCFYYITIS